MTSLNRLISADEITRAAEILADKIRTAHPTKFKVWGIPRGGVSAAYALSAAAPWVRVVDAVEQAEIIIDDLIDSGYTASTWTSKTGLSVATLFRKRSSHYLYGSEIAGNDWAVFPWEGTVEGSAEDIPRRLLQFIGEDPNRGGLKETPTRFLKAWREWTAGYAQDPATVLKAFEDGADGVDQLVIVKNIPVYSTCEHHLAPFFGTAAVGYIPSGKIVGLSKLSRVVDVYARRLQVQEKLSNQIADAVDGILKPKGVGVVISCRHLCMESRGIERQGSETITSALRGCILKEDAARAEFFNLTGMTK